MCSAFLSDPRVDIPAAMLIACSIVVARAIAVVDDITITNLNSVLYEYFKSVDDLEAFETSAVIVCSIAGLLGCDVKPLLREAVLPSDDFTPSALMKQAYFRMKPSSLLFEDELADPYTLSDKLHKHEIGMMFKVVPGAIRAANSLRRALKVEPQIKVCLYPDL